MYPSIIRTALLCVSLSACFPDTAQQRSFLAENAHLELRDARGVAWSPGAMPRSPVLRLWFETPSHSPESQRIWLLRGPTSAALLADLESPTVREHTAAQIVAVTLKPTPRYVDLETAAPLARDTRYTLVWASESGLAQRALRTADTAEAGAALRESLPAQGARDVPTNQRSLLWWFDGAIALPRNARAQLVHDAVTDSLALSDATCESLGFAAHHCAVAELPAGLVGGTRYSATLPADLRDGAGAVLPLEALVFDSAARADPSPPELVAKPCAVDENALGAMCVLFDESALQIRARSDEPALLTLLGCDTLGGSVSVLSELALTAARPRNEACQAIVRVRNGAGLFRDLPLSVPEAAPRAALSISEVRADPLGAEPDQEYVELFNFGSAAVSVAGFTLARDLEAHGVAFSDAAVIEAGERVLAVAPSFAARSASGDSEPAASVRLIHLTSALGLSASGTALALRDDQGRRLSASPALTAGEAGACIARRAADMRTGERAAFEADPALRCSPGAPTDWP